MNDYNITGDVNCADFIGGDKNITYGFGSEDVQRLIEKVLEMIGAGGVFLPDQRQPDVLQIEHNGETLRFRPGAARQLANQGEESSYLLSLTVDQEYQRWATRFVPLAGKMDVRQVIEGLPISFTEFIIPTGDAGMGAQPTQRPLKDITEAMNNHGAFVILGEPGAGKTTTMQKIAFDMARGLLKKEAARIPLFVRLSQQGERDPYSFLQVEWERRTGKPFAQALREGRILILADGINEIPRDKRNERLNAWMLFESQYRGANQLVFSGRDKDYENQLNLPRVLVEQLDEERVQEFLQKHKAEGLAELLNDPESKLDEMAGNPLNLFVLVMVYLRGGSNLQVLANRGRLFQYFTQELIAHEQLWHPDPTLSAEAKVELFARMAYEMQKQGSGTTFAIDSAKGALPKQTLTAFGEQVTVDPDALLRFGRGASILDPATFPNIRFYHHLLQEYFAARELLRRFNTGEELSTFWKSPRTKEEMPEEEVGEWDPLPEPPTTGWEVTTILACGLSSDPAKLIEAVRQHNPVLAGRCLDEAGIQNDDVEVKKAVRADLLADLYNPAIHLRARLQSGFILGRIGDPRFDPQEINCVKVILPQMVITPAGTYLIGNENDEELPQRKMDFPPFLMSKWSITNAEYRCFIEDGGYKNYDYWNSNLSIQWLSGDDNEEQFSEWMKIWHFLKETPNWKEIYKSKGTFSPKDIEYHEHLSSLSEHQVTRELRKSLPEKSRTQPHYWFDKKYNNPNQPVVGITWFEADAYCNWLTKILKRNFYLPSEFEWEASVNGLLLKNIEDNSFKSTDLLTSDPSGQRVLTPASAGVYKADGNVSPNGLEDCRKNIWNWTSTTASESSHDKNNMTDNERILRGGSCVPDRFHVRDTFDRDRFSISNYYYDVGFRIAASID